MAAQRQTEEKVALLFEAQRKTEEAQRMTEERMGQVLAMHTRLGHIVIRHEERRDALDGGNE